MTRILCSTTKSVMPRSRARREWWRPQRPPRPRSCPISARRAEASCGRTASARARSTRFWMPNGRSRTGAAASGAKLEGFEQRQRFAPRVALDSPRAAETDDGRGNAVNMMAVKAGQHVIEHGASRNSSTCWNVRPMPRAAMISGAKRGDRLHRRRRWRRCAGRTMPVIALISDVLPAPFGPIRPRISPCLDAHGDAAHRGDAAEADRDVVEVEQTHGQPRLPLGSRRRAATPASRRCLSARAPARLAE